MRGFTLLEIIIVVAIMSVVGAIGITSFRSFQRYADIDASANQIVAVLREARDRTAATDVASAYGVHFESGRYVRFLGPVYDEGAVTNVVYTLPPALELYDINVGGDSDIIFNSLDGSADQAGSTSIRVIDDPEEFRTIEIFSTGVVGISGVTVQTGSRIADSFNFAF
jgi:prepilin-type N-terminal cleavage/methylation domain-containing protein